MSGSQDHLSTQEFAKKAGVSASTVSKWLRTDKISGQKKNGKWVISSSELSKVKSTKATSTKKTTPAKTPTSAPASKQKTSGQQYTIQEFSAMTYLTEYGVQKWLKEGRLVGIASEKGKPLVAAANLDQPHVKRLIR